MATRQPSSNPRSWTRFFRFRLRTLFIAMTIVALFLGLVGIYWYRGLLESWAVQDLRDAGAIVVTDNDGSAVRVWLRGPTLDDERLTNLTPDLVRLPMLNEVDIVEAPITDIGLKPLENLKHIRLLYIHETQATDAGLKALAKALPGVDLRREKPDPIATKLVARMIFSSAVVAVACAPDGSWLATGSGDGTLRWWAKDETSPAATVNAHASWLFTVTFSPDGQMLATGGGDNLIKLWDVATHRLACELLGHTDDVHSVAFDPGGTWLYSAGDDRIVRVWDLATRKEIDSLHGHTGAIPSLAISPDGRTLASGSRDDTIRLWDVASPQRKLLRVLEGHHADVASVAFSPDGATLASAGYDRMVRVWNTTTGDERTALAGHADWVFAVAFSPDCQKLASGSGDGTVRTWDWQAKTNSAVYKGQQNVSCIRFNPTGRTMFSTAADGTIFIRNVASGSLTRVMGTRFGDRDLMAIRR